MPAFSDLAERTIGRLTVIEYLRAPDGRRKWKCLCACGSVVFVRADALTSGLTRSCGCLIREYNASRSSTPEDTAARFWSKVDKNGPVIRPELGPCWIWIGAKHEKGYGVFRVGSKRDGTARNVRANRFAYELTTGEVLGERQSTHRCDNPPCCNPSHLNPGTNADNQAESRAKGRDSHSRGTFKPLLGSAHPHAILTEDDVREIRAARGIELGVDLARRFGIDPAHVSAIQRRKLWKHVDSQRQPRSPT